MQTICWFIIIWSQFIDETVLHTSHEDNTMTMQKFSFREAELNQVFPKDNNNNNTKISMPDTPISLTSHSTNNLLALDDDDLEALVKKLFCTCNPITHTHVYLFIIII